MKTRSLLIGVAMAAALNCAAVNAQVLGGVGGGLGGGLSGGLRDMNMTTQGTLNGSFGADLDTSTLGRTTRDTAERATSRARNTTTAVRDRAAAKVDQTREKVGETRQVATATTSAAAATAVNAVDDVQIEGAADVAGSATSNVSRDGINLAGTAQGAGNGAVSGGTLPQPELTNIAPGKLAGGETANVSNAAQQVSQSTNDATPAQAAAEPAQSEKAAKPTPALNVSGDANGSASASRSGVSAQGDGSLSAAHK